MRNISLVISFCLLSSLQQAVADNNEQSTVSESSTSQADSAALKPNLKKNLSLSEYRKEGQNSDAPTSETKSENNDYLSASAALTIIKGLILVSLALILGLRIYNQIQKKIARSDEYIKVISRKNIGPKLQLLVVEIEEARFLLSQNGEVVNLLSPLGDKQNDFDRLLGINLENDPTTNNATKFAQVA